MFSICPCQIKISLERGGQRKSVVSQSLKTTARASSMKLRQFATIWSMPKSRRAASFQDFTTKFLGRTFRKRKILGSQLWPSNTSEGLLAPSIKKTLISRPQSQLPLIQLHQRLGLQLSQGPGTISESAADQLRPAALANTPKRIEPRSHLVPDPSLVFSFLKLGGFFTNAFSFSLAEPPRLAG